MAVSVKLRKGGLKRTRAAWPLPPRFANISMWSKLFLIFALLGALSLVRAQSEYCLADADETGSICTTLYAGQTIVAGEVCVSIEADSFVVDLTTTGEWNVNLVHLWMGLNLADAPVTRSGNPIPGQFPYTCTPDLAVSNQTCSLTVPFEDIYGEGYPAYLPCDDTVWHAVHAEVYRVLPDGTVVGETAWGDGDPFVDRGNWGMYNSVYVVCDCDVPCTDCTPGCETAFAKYGLANTCFLDIPSKPAFNRWGWSNGPLSTALTSPSQTEFYTMEIWAAAGQCDTSKGTLVGELRVIVTTEAIMVVYDMGNTYGLEETHLYIGTDPLPLVQQGKKQVQTVAPGQYPYIHEDLEGVTQDTFVIPNTFGGGDIYVVAHGVVCSDDL